MVSRCVSLIVLVAVVAGLEGCSRGYPQDEPERVLDAAHEMVLEGDADRLVGLLWSDTPEMRELYRRFGVTLGHLQTLAKDLKRRFPEEVAKIESDARNAAEKGEAGSLFASMMGGRRQRGSGDDDAFNRTLQKLFADPYGWLERSRDRLSTQSIDDERAAIMWDGKPVPPVGLTMRKEEGRWYVVPPTQFLSWSTAMPRTDEEYAIVAAMIKTLDNVLVDLSAEVDAGRHRDLESVSRRAGEMAWMPLIMQGVAYGKALEAREEEGEKSEEGG
jgi:hypothetical protein